MTSPQTGSWDVDPARIDRNWRAIVFELDAPRPSRLERLLNRLGLPSRLSRVMVATPALRRAWFVAVALAVIIGVGPYDGTATPENLFLLLLIAPLVPVLGVSMAYGIEADPAHEVAVATPLRGVKLVVIRASVVVAVAVVFCSLASLLAPGVPALAFAWLLPALGLTTATLALMTVLSPRLAAAVSAGAWVIGVFAVRGSTTDRLAAFGPVGQAIMASLTVVALIVIWLRRERFDRLELSW